MTNVVRPSRDGDQFHYLWAARRCLLLLSEKTDLVGLSIEGVSPDETPSESDRSTADTVIDVAEYYGHTDPTHARRICYIQLKHSSRHAKTAWTASGLEETLRGFSAKYKDLLKKYGVDRVVERFEFWFVTNRPISRKIAQAVEDAARCATPRYSKEVQKLQRFTDLTDADLSRFCSLLRFEGRQDDYWNQRNILFQEVSGYLPNSDVDAPTQLKELVTRKALSESEQDPLIEQRDVLRALKTDEDRLYPARCQVADIPNAVVRQQEADLVQKIVQAEGRPVIIHALAGAGKSVFATRIPAGLPSGSVSILYDCFGNGSYRSASGSRHRHQDALVQIANELAAKAHCHPLIPTVHAGATEYARAFVYRLRQAIASIRSTNPSAVLCIVIDAADNAQQAAKENGQARSFARDLLRETLPEGVRLVVLCRSHRQHLLDPPARALPLELSAFNHAETADHLLRSFPDASGHDAEEFHRLSSQNPRVQALALSQAEKHGWTLEGVLRSLGPQPTTVDHTIQRLLEEAVATLKDSPSDDEARQIDRVCEGLALLRPLVPLSVLADVSGVSERAIRSFVLDIGRPLLLTDDAVQFRDEPVETWFRERFKLGRDGMSAFIHRLMRLATGSAYVAATLPRLMLEAGQLSELVELALGSFALPATGVLQRRDIAFQRAQFALKASLRSRRYVDAAKLALKAGEQTAGDARRRRLIQSNTDLAALFLEPVGIQEVVSRRMPGSDWRGSNHVYEAGLLSFCPSSAADARSRLRMADDWLNNWARLTAVERENERISENDIAELVAAQLNVHGPEAAARAVGKWRPRRISFTAGRIVAERLVDAGRIDEAKTFAAAGRDDWRLVLAVILELREVQQTPSTELVQGTFRRIASLGTKATNRNFEYPDKMLSAILALVEAALKRSVCTRREASAVLTRCLPETPPRGLASHFADFPVSLLRAYSLRAALQSETLELVDLAHPELRAKFEKQSSHHLSQESEEFKRNIGALLAWLRLWAAVSIGQITRPELPEHLARARKAAAPGTVSRYRDGRSVAGHVALAWFDILNQMNAIDAGSLNDLVSWLGNLGQPPFTPYLNALARLGIRRRETRSFALEMAARTCEIIRNERLDAETKSGYYVDAARAVLAGSIDDSKAYFGEAVAVASKIGDEHLARWNAVVDLGERAAQPHRPVPEIAYRFARCSELTYDYVVRDKYFDWNSTVRVLSSLCPCSLFAILGRWRDRNFGLTEVVLPAAVESLVERRDVDPRGLLPLIGFSGEWEYAPLLDAVLSRCTTAAAREAAKTLTLRHAKFSSADISTCKQLRRVVTRHGLDVSDLDAAIAFAEREQRATSQARLEYPGSGSVADESLEWNGQEIFAGHDVTTSDGIGSSYSAFKQTSSSLKHDEFFAEAVRRIPPGKELAFLTAARGLVTFDLYCYSKLFAQIPESWRRGPAVRQSLADTVEVICRRHSLKIAKHRDWEAPPFDDSFRRIGVGEADIIDVVLDGIGESTDALDCDRLFSVVGLLASKLDGDEALEALDFGLGLYDSILEYDDGDGPWSDNLEPAATVEASIAGYIYAGLGAPCAAVRWESAHAVVGLCALDREDTLRHLMTFAHDGNGGSFVDGRLPFYRLHAFQWLMIACARAATEYAVSLAPFAWRFVDWALEDQSHVLIRQFAARTALSLRERGLLLTDERLDERLRRVNTTSLPRVESNCFRRVSQETMDADICDDKDRYYFYMDVGPYWYKPLGEVFALSQSRIETEALKVIRKELHRPTDGRAWRDDERKRRGLYPRDRYGYSRTYVSHGSYPDTDDYEFYLAYHAMMVVAGRLLATRPTHWDTEHGGSDEFLEWLSRHDLTRDDGRWLADRRDSEPLERPAWLERKDDGSVYGAIVMQDFDEALGMENRLTVWGSWSKADVRRVQTVRVRSALVSQDRSAALARALSTVDNVYDYVIPGVGGHHNIEKSGFELRGWIEDCSRDDGLDSKDSRAGDVRYPPPAPAAEVVASMGLETDVDMRLWRDEDGERAMESRVWSDANPNNEETRPERGDRLVADVDFLKRLLGQRNRDLIITVNIERTRRHWRDDPQENYDERTSTETRLYLVNADGRIASL